MFSMTTRGNSPRFLILAVLILGWGATGCSGPKSLQGEYQVVGSGGASSASVTYLTPAGASTGAVSVSLPWSYSFTGYETEGSYKGTSVSLSAQNDSGAGSVTVIINEDSKVFQQSWATWPQAAITVLGTF